MNNPIEIRAIATEETYDLRLRVLRPGRGPEEARFVQDADAAHFGAVSEGRIVAIATIFEQPLAGDPRHAWQLRGMAVDEAFRGRNCGAALVRACIRHARAQGAEVLWCNARESAAKFYEKQGFAIHGERFEIPDVGPHFVMVKPL